MAPVTSQLRRILPAPIKDIIRPWYNHARDIRYEMNLRNLGTSKKELLILATIAKSGTHYMKFLFANYLKLASGSDEGPVSPSEMNAMLPNTWQSAYLGPRNFENPTPLLSSLGLQDIPRTHYGYQRFYWDDSKVLHLYRNPLDYAVSLFHYKYTNREHLSSAVASPDDALTLRLNDYAEIYLSYREAARQDTGSLLRLSYEDLVRFPETCLRIVIKWLGVEPEPTIIQKAARYSSRDTVSQMEQAGETINPTATNFTGTFVRDGSIGQWKEYFDSKAVQTIQERFGRFGIDLNEFTLEP
jgi:hypothetical protein